MGSAACRCLDQNDRSLPTQIVKSDNLNQIPNENGEVSSDEENDNPSNRIMSGNFLNTPINASNQLLSLSYHKKPDHNRARSTQIQQASEGYQVAEVRRKALTTDQCPNKSPDIQPEYLKSPVLTTTRMLSDYIVETAKHIHQPMQIQNEQFVRVYKESISKYYELEQKVGEGTYGSVFRARCKTSNELRAIKILKKKRMLTQQNNSFLAQMELLKKLDHPNIIKLFEIFFYNNSYYVVTEYCSGGTIIDFLSKSGKYSEDVLKLVFSQIMSALTYMHGQRIVHRDIKLENMVFLNPVNFRVTKTCEDSTQTEDICLKIIDFGGATIFKYTKNTSTSVFGTTSYMAPEVIQGIFNDRCDIWSAGVILHILLTGNSPFKCRVKEETYRKIKSRQITCMQTQWETVSHQAIDLVKLMLQKDFTKRITAQECLKHPWLNQPKVKRQNKKVKTVVLQNLSNYYRENNLVSIIESFLVFKKISQGEREQLARLFKKIDKDKNGSIDVQQLIEAYSQYQGNQDPEEIAFVLNKIDKNKSGKIDFSEFLGAVYGRKRLFVRESLSQAFQYLDANKTGFLQKKELGNALKGCDKLEIQKIVDDLDKNKDAKISKQEFIEYFMSKVKAQF